MRALCVFCGSNPGRDAAFIHAARAMGQLLAHRDITLVYGGGSVGLMGAVADSALRAGGRVIGVIPRTLLEREVGHHDLTELHVVNTMHERKALMNKLSDGFAVLPGGIGTLEEFFEIWTWAQLGIHAKPFGVLEVNGYWSGLFTFLDSMAGQGFVKREQRDLVRVAQTPADLLDALAAYTAPPLAHWLETEQI